MLDSVAPVVEFQRWSVRSREDQLPARRWNLRLVAGDIALASMRRHRSADIVIRTILGLRSPSRGICHVRGRPWADLKVQEVFETRYRIGCLFDGTSWIQNLTLRENLLWPTMHRGDGLDAAARKLGDRLDWIRSFADRHPSVRGAWRGLVSDVAINLDRRPSFVSDRVSMVAQIARIAMTDPWVVIASLPMRGIDFKFTPVLADLWAAWLDADATIIAFDRDEVLCRAATGHPPIRLDRSTRNRVDRSASDHPGDPS